MSGFSVPPPEIPSIPIDIPTPNIPQANFAAIGQQMEQGKQASGVFSNIMQLILDWLPSFIGAVIGGILNVILQVLAYFMKILNQVWAQAEGGTDAVAAQAVSGLFGISVGSATFASVTNPSARVATSADVANAIMGSLGFNPNAPPTGSIAPSATAANNFIQKATHLAIEGWLQGWIFEAVSAGQIETFAELKDIMAHVLGLGRMAHTVLHPMVKVTTIDPLTYLLNTNLRPKLWGEADGVRAYLRGLIQQPELHTHLMYQGYTDSQIENAIKMGAKTLGASDLETLVQYGVLADADAVQKLKDQGYDDWTAHAALQVPSTTRIAGINHEILRAAMEGFVQRKMTEGDWEAILSQLTIPAGEIELWKQLATLKAKLNFVRPSIGEAGTLVKKGIWGVDQFMDVATFHGYQGDDETSMELLILEELTTASEAASAKQKVAAAKAAKAAAAAAAASDKAAAAKLAAEAKGVSIAQYQALLKLGLKTITDYKTFLTDKGIAADNVAALVAAEQLTLDAQQKASSAGTSAAAAVKAKNLSLAQLDQAAKAGIITTDEYQTRLLESGVDAADAGILVQLLTDQIQAAALKASTAAAHKAAAAVKGLNLAQEETAVELGLQTMADYSAFLQARGYDSADVATLTSELQAKVDKLKSGVALKGGATAAAATKGLNLAQLEKLVRNGVKTIDDYTAALATLGYSADDQQALASLLELQMRADQEELASNGRAAALIGQRGLSLAQLANAVTLGVVPMSVYTDALAAAGVAAKDVTTLQLALAAKIAGKKKTTASALTASKLLSDAGLSLPTLEKDYLAGRLNLDQFNGLLQTAGVSADDIAAIGQLLASELSNQQALAALTADATTRAAAKGLSLSQETAAVKAGVKTIDDFQAFVASLGYDASDVATLVATLQVALNKSQAAGSSAAVPPTTSAP